MNEKELILVGLDYILTLFQLNETQRLKGEAVKAQDFELACEWREKEKVLQTKIPSFEDISKLRENLKQTI